MTRKDFQLIADILSKHASENSYGIDHTVKAIALDFAHALQATNPRFDVQRFVKACTNTK
jgi:hypothetical protein